MKPYDIEPHPRSEQVVYTKDRIMFLPLYSGRGYVGPGYFRNSDKIYQDYELTKMGAIRSIYRLWDR
jgi:hypothetical protein